MKVVRFIVLIGVFALFAFIPVEQAVANAEKATYTAQDPLAESMKRGAEIYTEYCIQCHLGKGEGLPGTFPPLAQSDWLTPEKRAPAIGVVKYGQSGAITVNGVTYNSAMAALGLYDDEVADVMNYILNNWGNSSDKIVTEEEVKKITKN